MTAIRADRPAVGDGEFAALAARLTAAIDQATRRFAFDNPRASDEQLRGEGLRYIWRTVAAGLVSQIEGHDPAYPHFFKILSPWLNWGYPNPDGTYAFTSLHGDYSYRLFGTRGTARLFDVEVWEGDISDLRNARSFGGLRDICGGKGEIEIDADGSFEIIFSTSEHAGNWIALPPGFAHLYVRQWYYDHEKERPGQLYVERIDATYPRPPLTSAELAASFERLIAFVETVHEPLALGVEQHYAGDGSQVPFPAGLLSSGSDSGGQIAFRNQCYGRGHFECAPGEAVILELEPPRAEYWMFGLLSPFWESYDWLGRQISINGHQAVIDEDGRFRAVISHEDPGVPNWLDACGHTDGLIGGRYNWTEDVPIPTLRTVRVDQLDRVLPASTRRITPEQRSELLRRRLHSQQRRQVAW
jgi:hypothetical protein